jgi:hypothetical protein
VSSAIYTDDEEELRARAWRFTMPAHERAFFARQLAEAVRTRVLPVVLNPNGRRRYFAAMMENGGRSPVSRYRRLSEDVVADGKLLEPFAAAAERVLAADAVRLRALAYVHDLSPSDVRDAVLRVAENRCLVAWVRFEIEARAIAYRYALEHLFIEAPEAEGVPTERALRWLEDQRAVLDALPGGPWSPSCGLPPPPVEAVAVATSVSVAPASIVAKD